LLAPPSSQPKPPTTDRVPVRRERPQIQITEPDPPPLIPPRAQWGLAGSQVAGRCTQFEPLLEALAPEGGWDVQRMSRYANRESGCCPQVLTADGWRTTQGGDRFDASCRFSHVAVWHHRSDAGLLQINGVSYDPGRCKNTCLSVWLEEPVNVDTLGDPALNVRAAAELCEFGRRAFGSCYQPWRRT
jgi:hypothetical protein